jgi:hypothetical protein
MNSALRRALSLALLVGVLAADSALAAGPTGWGGGSCREVTAFPANLAAPGVYCLSWKYIDFPMTSGVLIRISADNVVLDLNGTTLDGTPTGASSSSSAFGVVSTGHSNIVVRNGTIKGFNQGIHLTAPLGMVNTRIRTSHAFLVEDMRLLNNRSAGMYIVGNDSVIRRNYVAHTGGSDDPGVSGHAWGVIAAGTGLRILDNIVSYTVANTVHPGGVTMAIWLAGAWDAMIVGNRIGEADFGINGSGNWGKYRDNITVNVGVPYTGGTDIGNNN